MGRERTGVWRSVAWWVAATLVYVSFVTPTWTQVMAGALVAAPSVALTRRALQATGLRIGRIDPRIWRLGAVAAILRQEVAAVVGALARQLRGGDPVHGRYVGVALEHEPDAGEDAAITLEASVAPNTYVVGVVGDVLLVHQFDARPGPGNSFPRWHP